MNAPLARPEELLKISPCVKDTASLELKSTVSSFLGLQSQNLHSTLPHGHRWFLKPVSLNSAIIDATAKA